MVSCTGHHWKWRKATGRRVQTEWVKQSSSLLMFFPVCYNNCSIYRVQMILIMHWLTLTHNSHYHVANYCGIDFYYLNLSVVSCFTYCFFQIAQLQLPLQMRKPSMNWNLRRRWKAWQKTPFHLQIAARGTDATHIYIVALASFPGLQSQLTQWKAW